MLKFQKDFQAQLENESPIPEPFYTPTKAHLELTTEGEQAEAKLTAQINLDLILAFAYASSPSIKAARENFRATLEQYPQAVYLDNLLRQYNAFTKQLDTKIGHPHHKEMLAMKFPFPDTLALKGQIITEDVQIAQTELDITLRDLVTDIKLAYYDYLYLNKAIEINQQNQQLVRQMIQIAQARFRAGIGKYHNVIMAQVELFKLSDSIITLEEQRENHHCSHQHAVESTRRCTVGDAGTTHARRCCTTFSRKNCTRLHSSSRQEIQKQKLMISKLSLTIQLTTRMTYPDPTLGASYFEERMKLPPTFSTQRTLNTANSASFGRKDAYIREVEIKTHAMQQQLAELENMTRFTVKKHHFGLETAKRSIALYRNTLLPQARGALEAANTAYQAAQVDFISLLDAQRTLLNLRLAEQGALRDHRHHLAQLEQVVGQILPKQPLAETEFFR